MSRADAVGRTVASLAAERGVAGLDAALDLSLADDLQTWFGFVFANDDEAAVGDILRLDGAVLGLSDAGAHPAQLCDAVLPTDLLGGWVRDRGALTLEHAVHKLTAEIADLLGFADRGRLPPVPRPTSSCSTPTPSTPDPNGACATCPTAPTPRRRSTGRRPSRARERARHPPRRTPDRTGRGDETGAGLAPDRPG